MRTPLEIAADLLADARDPGSPGYNPIGCYEDDLQDLVRMLGGESAGESR